MAAERLPTPAQRLVARGDQPLIGILVTDGEHSTVVYYTDDAVADETLQADDVQAALRLAGAWSDVDWDDLEAGLDRIRHESKPTPPLAP